MKFLQKKKKGIGGLLFLLTVAIGTLTLGATTALCTRNNIKYIVNQSAYFVVNKAAVNLYNTNAPSGTYSSIARVRKSNYVPNDDYNHMLEDTIPGVIDGWSSAINVHWDKDTKTASCLEGDIGSITVHGHNVSMFNGASEDYNICPNEIRVILER